MLPLHKWCYRSNGIVCLVLFALLSVERITFIVLLANEHFHGSMSNYHVSTVVYTHMLTYRSSRVSDLEA